MIRKYVIIIVIDIERYVKFVVSCSLWCVFDEEYF